FLVHILVVHYQQAVVGAAVNGEVMDAVMVRAHLLSLVGTGVAAILHIRRHAAEDRCAPGQESPRSVAFRHHDGVVATGRDGLEAQARLATTAAAVTATGSQ